MFGNCNHQTWKPYKCHKRESIALTSKFSSKKANFSSCHFSLALFPCFCSISLTPVLPSSLSPGYLPCINVNPNRNLFYILLCLHLQWLRTIAMTNGLCADWDLCTANPFVDDLTESKSVWGGETVGVHGSHAHTHTHTHSNIGQSISCTTYERKEWCVRLVCPYCGRFHRALQRSGASGWRTQPCWTQSTECGTVYPSASRLMSLCYCQPAGHRVQTQPHPPNTTGQKSTLKLKPSPVSVPSRIYTEVEKKQIMIIIMTMLVYDHFWKRHVVIIWGRVVIM